MLHTINEPTPLSRWRILSAAPHRPMFLAGAVQLILVMLLWIAELVGRSLGAPLALTLASTWTHGFFMLYGLFPFFIFGFLFTVYPRWMGGAEVPRHQYVTVFALTVLGMAVTYAGLLIARGVLAIGLLLYLGGWATALVALLAIYRRAPAGRTYETILNVALAFGAIGVACFLYGVLTDEGYAFIAARALGLWGFLIPVLLTVSHRMIPFFTQSALPFTVSARPAWGLPLFVGGSLLHGVFEIAGMPAARVVVDLALAAVALYHSWLWGLRRSFAVRLLAMLHIAFLWFGVAMTLYTLQGALGLMGVTALGRAPLHALGIGFVTSMLLAMATRVTLGHSGRALAVKAPTWYLFLGFNLVALLRAAAEFTPAAYQALNLLVAAGWLICLVPWVLHYAPLYLRPRADARPG